MSIPKLRAAVIVFLVGFALGLSVFAASRLFVRAVLNSEAILAAQELAADIDSGRSVGPASMPSSVVRYTQFDLDGNVVASAAVDSEDSARPQAAKVDTPSLNSLVQQGSTVIEDASVFLNIVGFSESAIKRVAVPVVTDGKLAGSLLVHVNQSRALDSLTRAFSVVAMVTLALAVLAVIAVAFVVTRGAGFRERKVFDPSSVPHDPLTGVPARSGFVDILDDAVTRASETDQQVLMMIVDIDRFSAVNGIWGHAVGDAVLKMAADRLKGFASGPAGVARVSGDQFALIVEEGEESLGMRQLADKIRNEMGEPFEVDGATIMISVSIGAALYPINADDGEMLFRAAAGALAKAKQQGRSAFGAFDTEMKERMQRTEALEGDLRAAIEREEFVVFYQPQVNLATGSLRGYEALVRWERPGEGILAPHDFLAVAKDTGLIRPIGEWVLRKACEDAATWLHDGCVSVNFSAQQFRSHEIDKTIAGVLEETGLPAERLEIEVPESLFIDCAPETMVALKRIKALGVRVAMDDFGSGYSGLASLAQFPFDKIKIDRSFVNQLTQDRDVAAIVASIVTLGRTISVDVTAEGVETKDQVMLLKAAGCNIVQGFLFGTPQRKTAPERQTAAEAEADEATADETERAAGMAEPPETARKAG